MSTPAEVDERIVELKAFDETRTGAKGVSDSGVGKIPSIFICPPDSDDDPQIKSLTSNSSDPPPQVPIIDLADAIGGGSRRAEIADEICRALETWGFFRLVNHGVPAQVMASILRSTREFHDQPQEKKMDFYSRDPTKKVRYYSTGDMYQTKVAQWRDTFSVDFEDTGTIDPESLPQICRKELGEYINCLRGLRDLLGELLSEGLGLESGHLYSLECLEIQKLVCQYYPACPQPELTIGIRRHSDPYFLTILLQDHVGGLQVLHNNQWLDVQPIEGSFVINAGDLLQLISNGKLQSVEHRVLAPRVSRVSAACFMFPNSKNIRKPYGPLKELVSPNTSNPPKYQETTYQDYIEYYGNKGLGGEKALHHFQLTT